MNDRFEVYADLENPIPDHPNNNKRGDLILYKGQLYKTAIVRGSNVGSMPPEWKLVIVVRKKIQGRIASVLELVSIDS